ncbi:unnamed protein product [Mytilus coruscus]|uniref:Uncharacterized protein n=1 Tax=Mytilus coruscus TaxID=42192 RepID=A0A6J8E260_MYTCO|nr:unnamed protein product [Mytilus coruscus]
MNTLTLSYVMSTVIMVCFGIPVLNTDKAIQIATELVSRGKAERLVTAKKCFTWCISRVKFDPTGEICTQVCNTQFPTTVIQTTTGIPATTAIPTTTTIPTTAAIPTTTTITTTTAIPTTTTFPTTTLILTATVKKINAVKSTMNLETSTNAIATHVVHIDNMIGK